MFVESLKICKEMSQTLPRYRRRGAPISQDSLKFCRSSTLSSITKYPADELFVYRSALVLPEKPLTPNEASLQVYTAVVVFNLALTHHHIGMMTGRSGSFVKAEKLYATSTKILHFQNPLSLNETTCLIFLAANNNLAQIALEKGMIITTNSRLLVLSQVLRRFSDKHREAFTSQELNGIQSNTFLLMGRGLSASPAA